MAETSKQPKKWYKRKRIWLAAIAVLLIYFCLVPSRTQFSSETTGIVGHIPLTSNGKVDYFVLFEKTYIDKLSPPEDNGQRLMIAAFGPVVLEQNGLVNEVAWEDMPTNERSKKWFEEQWLPLCEHLYIDPYRKPMFYEKRGYFSYMNKYLKEQEKNRGENSPSQNPNYERDESNVIFRKLTTAPWKREDAPEVGKWLDEYSEVLDYFGMSVRKPNFTSWRKKNGEGSLFSILLPDVQADRDFARSLAVRISERVGRGDIEGAWYDVMTLKYLARHFMKDSIIVTNLVGIAIDGIANASVKLILANCKPTEEQFAKFIRDLDNLPPPDPISASLVFEQFCSFQFLQFLHNKWFWKRAEMIREGLDYSEADNFGKLLCGALMLPFDMNIAGKRMKELLDESGLSYLDVDKPMIVYNPTLRRQFAEKLGNVLIQTKDKINFRNQFYKMPLIHTRSKLVAECVFVLLAPAVDAARKAFERNYAEDTMLRVAMMSERYHLANGKYPDKLEDLVPKYIDMVPIDPCTGRTTFVYKLRSSIKESEPEPDTKQPTETTTTTNKSPEPLKFPYILYSLGHDGKDDNGIRQNSGKDGFDLVF